MQDEPGKEVIAKRRKIEEIILTHIFEQRPKLKDNKDIEVTVSPLKPDRGRFGRAKERWTIDLKEQRTRSRKKQVFVKVTENGTWDFDIHDLDRYVYQLEQIVAKFDESQKLFNEAKRLIPATLPRDTKVEVARELGGKPNALYYRVTLRKLFNSATEMIAFIGQLDKVV